MLELKNIVKVYKTDSEEVSALKGVTVSFRDNEFVSVLGPSGCGKTTMLNIIGGLDRYTSGDLVINGRSTKEYSDRDWDTYRNHSVGFVFQNYNLIPHQTILSNVELALTLSGVSKDERRKRAREALEKVGLGDQLKKRPNQLSGGQMQRVAIARALVNDPDIILADEPTGALDSVTSVQIMDILKEISKNKLIIMVTHNAELAEQYSTRIVRLLDGNIVGDNDVYSEDEHRPAEKAEKKNRKSMSFFTALSLSFNNLLTKKGRTFMTAFAGSIGIIGIALILALSTGVKKYIDDVQKDTLSSYPLTIEAEQADLTALFGALGAAREEQDAQTHELDAIYCNSRMYAMFNALISPEISKNNLTAFKAYLDEQMNEETSDTNLYDYVSSIQYQYGISLNNYVIGPDGKYHSSDVNKLFSSMYGQGGSEFMSSSLYSNSMMDSLDLWQELLPGKNGEAVSDVVHEQYELIYGKWPEKANEVVLIVDDRNEISDITFYALGLVSEEEVKNIMSAAVNQETLEPLGKTMSYEEICDISFKLLLNSDYYTDNDGDGIYTYIGDDESMMNMVIKNGYDLNIVGILRDNSENATSMSVNFGYTNELTKYVVEKTGESPVVKAQISEENKNFDVLSGRPFVAQEEEKLADSEKAERIQEYFDSLNDEEKCRVYTQILSTPDKDYMEAAVTQYMAEYKTREDMEALVSSTYGLDAETTKSYLEAYSDEELKTMIEEQIQQMVSEQFKAEAEKQMEQIKNAPSEEELAPIVAAYTAQLTDRQTKVGFVTESWKASMTMDPAAIAQYLMSISDEELDRAVYSVAAQRAAEAYAQIPSSDESGKTAKAAKAFDEYVSAISENEAVMAEHYDLYMPSSVSDSTLSDNLKLLGVQSMETPTKVNIYASTFENKDMISDIIKEYNKNADEDDQISYTDYIALLMSGITTIINAISYVLIAFVSISLIVSSIMIGIITYISVLERTKEIGILRSVGASKKDISRVFNAETLIVGFCAGAIGIIVSLLLCVPINLIVHSLTGIDTINAYLPAGACIVLVCISMLLTVIAGLIPSRVAAKKDPVEALRTE